MNALCVFCGASHGNRPVYGEAAATFGSLLGQRRIELVWGAGHVGLMGVVADAALAAGGEVWGAIPVFMVERELAHPEASEILVTPDMHTRKAAMAARAEAFVALPGGFGTLDELFEILTWAQLGLHHKPIGLLNVEGYFDPLIQMIDHMQREGFLRSEHRELVIVDADPISLLERLGGTRA